MLAGAQMTRMPDDIARGREDFQTYMKCLMKQQNASSAWPPNKSGDTKDATGLNTGGQTGDLLARLPAAGTLERPADDREPLTIAWSVADTDNNRNAAGPSDADLIAQVQQLTELVQCWRQLWCYFCSCEK